MYTIISGTNRKGSNTLKVAKEYHRLLKGKGIEVQLFSLENVNLLHRDHDFEKIEKEILLPTDKFIFIVPEYNGSFPGTLKMLVDTSRSNQIWWHKKAMLTGVSTGRAGNLRGMDHFATILNYLKITVYPNLLPISSVDKLLDAQEQFSDNNTLIAIHQQLDGFIEWSNQ